MHLRLVLIAAMAALVTSCNAAPTPTNSYRFNLSKTDAAPSNRFLRNLHPGVKTTTGDGDEDEERAAGNLGKLDDVVDNMVDDIPSLVKTFKHWKGLSAKDIFQTPAALALIEKASNKGFMKVFNLYGEYNLLGTKAFVDKLERIKQKARAGLQ